MTQYPANNFPGYSSPASDVFIPGWSGGLKFIYNYDIQNYQAPFQPTLWMKFILQTTAIGRDVEVTTMVPYGCIFLRLNAGRALCWYYTQWAGFQILFVDGVTNDGTQQQPFGGDSTNFVSASIGSMSIAQIQAIVPSFQPTTDFTYAFTVGASGFDVYVKLNGTEIYRTKCWFHMARGVVAFKANSNYGFTNIKVHWLPSPELYSNVDAGVYDLRDLGLKSLTATGSMTAGSNQLTLTSNPGFAVGDKLIVQIGGESGAGQRGTVGVGGTWPLTSYATVAAMNADTSKADTWPAWVTATGDCYWSYGGVWSSPNYYYYNKVVPRSLIAGVTAVSGNTLTLDTAATVATTNATVYFDNALIITKVVQNDTDFYNTASLQRLLRSLTILVPAGSFAVSSRIMMYYRNNWILKGVSQTASELFSPRGVIGLNIEIQNCQSCFVQDLSTRGNCRFQGFGLVMPADGSYVGTSISNLEFAVSYNCEARRIKITDSHMKAVGTSYGTNCWARNCDCYLTDGLLAYIQWQFQFADSNGGGATDCTVTSPILTAGFESFRSDGAGFWRCTGTNATQSLNSAGNWVLEDCTYIIQANSQYNAASFSSANPIININSNVQPPNASISAGGVIRRPTITQQGPINAVNDILNNIVVNQYNPNITVLGTYPDTPGPKGLIQGPDWVGPGSGYGVGYGVNCTGANCLVDGIRFVGAMDPANISFQRKILCGSPGSLIIRNSVFDGTVCGDGTIDQSTNNQSNATWQSTH